MYESFIYVTSAPYFWQTMGWTTASAMFVGATLYNGNYKMFTKGIFTVVPYSLFIFLVNSIRIYDYLHNSDVFVPRLAYAGNISLVLLSFFYFLGLTFGVLVTRIVLKKGEQ